MATSICRTVSGRGPPPVASQNDKAVVTFKTENKRVNLIITRQAATPELSVNPTVQTISAAGGIVYADIISNTDWIVSSNQSWAQIDRTSGSGNAKINISILPNVTTQEDTAIITFKAAIKTVTLTINRQAAIPVLVINPTTINAPANGGDVYVDITSNVDWVAESDQNWAKINQPTGYGNRTVLINVSPNTSTQGDRAIITFKTKSLSTRLIINRDAETPFLHVTPTQSSINAVGGNIKISVISNCSWNVNVNQEWITCDVNQVRMKTTISPQTLFCRRSFSAHEAVY